MTRRKRKHASHKPGSRYSGTRLIAATFAATVFLGAWLLFLVQPLIAKFILPWFGGTPMVWTVCMLFFQSVLFLGYAYAHALDSLLPLRAQACVHFLLLVVAVALMPITPAVDWQPSGTEDPTWHIMCLLAVCLGMPYLLLAATGPLLQAWYRALPGDASPYRLYSISNLGSLLALIGYPFVIDSALGASAQTTFWSWLFFAFAIVCSYCAWVTLRHGRQEPRTPQNVSSSGADRPTWLQCGLWFSLAMLPTVMLLAVTDQICTDVAAVPFLWILPLTLYLLSFILCFRSLRWCSRNLWAILWAVSVLGTIPVMFLGLGVNTSVPVLAQIGVFCGLLFACAMVCHGELVRRKPSPRYLTMFYLILSAGGAAGGILVGVVAPQMFPTYVELPLAMVGCTVLLMGVFYFAPESKLYRGQPRWAWSGLLASALLMMACLTILFQQQLAGVQSIYRNFYGVLQVKQLPGDDHPDAPLYRLIHGRTMHGMQYSTEPRRRWPTSYYGRDSGIGLVLGLGEPGQTKRVGVIGLGT